MKAYKTLVMVIALASASSAFAFAYPYYEWEKSGGVYDGVYTNTPHWSGSPTLAAGTWPGCYDEERTHAGEYAAFDFRSSQHDGLDTTIAYPQGVVTNLGQFLARTSRKMRLRFDGSDTTLWFPRPTGGSLAADGNRGTYYMQYAIGNPFSPVFVPDLNGQPISEAGLYTFENFRYCLTNDVTESRVEFESGNFTFHNIPYYKLFLSDSFGDYPTRVFQADAGANLTINATTAFFLRSTNQLVRAKGGKIRLLSQIWSMGQSWGQATRADYNRLLGFEAVEGGELTMGPLTGGNDLTFAMGADPSRNIGDSSTTTVRVLADNGTVKQPADYFTSKAYGPGTHEFIFRNGSAASFAGEVLLGNVAGAHGLIRIADSTATFARSVTMGGASAAMLC